MYKFKFSNNKEVEMTEEVALSIISERWATVIDHQTLTEILYRELTDMNDIEFTSRVAVNTLNNENNTLSLEALDWMKRFNLNIPPGIANEELEEVNDTENE